jgi:hypothetical protein
MTLTTFNPFVSIENNRRDISLTGNADLKHMAHHLQGLVPLLQEKTTCFDCSGRQEPRPALLRANSNFKKSAQIGP